MFLAGAPIAVSLYGGYPSLKNPDENNPKFTTNFRQVYATVLVDWLGAPAEIVLGGRVEHLPLLKPAALAASG